MHMHWSGVSLAPLCSDRGAAATALRPVPVRYTVYIRGAHTSHHAPVYHGRGGGQAELSYHTRSRTGIKRRDGDTARDSGRDLGSRDARPNSALDYLALHALCLSVSSLSYDSSIARDAGTYKERLSSFNG